MEEVKIALRMTEQMLNCLLGQSNQGIFTGSLERKKDLSFTSERPIASLLAKSYLCSLEYSPWSLFSCL